ncbi:unnamed protein product [Leptidea sinapis]|uniref:Uncharacterized protein n=1 Tax=Leptidea sinapis TaxID=189913 RepID=A0A5E4PN86_9NEOP|nr:unnamed protein product [Leptidea sinapis]
MYWVDFVPSIIRHNIIYVSLNALPRRKYKIIQDMFLQVLKQMQLADAATGDGTTTTESNKITRQEFLKILDRNLKGLARLRSLEWREAKKESIAPY